VILRLGDTPVSKAQRLWIEASDPESVWWLDEGGQWGEPSHRVTRIIRGGATSLLVEAAAALARDSTGVARRERHWCRAFESSNAVARKAVDDIALGEAGWSGLAIASVVARAAPSGAQLFTSNSMSIRLLDLGFSNRGESLCVHCNRGASGIDGVTSTALGTAAASKRPSLLLTGDLALLHDASGLLVARRESIPLTIVVIDDNGGGIFSMLPIAAQGEEVAYQELFRTPHEIDLAKLASLFELDYSPVRNPAELEAAIEEAHGRPGVTIVHARIDAEANEATFRRSVAAGCAAVDAEISK
jgi:2-succinyl-5-enolpyruvyl-6-hydroxy-3-cyclohexene-1-carboxylate synthase